MACHFMIRVVACKFTILDVHIHDRSTKVRILNQCDLSVYESRTAFNVTWRETKFEVVFVVFPKVHIRAELDAIRICYKGWLIARKHKQKFFFFIFQPKESSVQ